MSGLPSQISSANRAADSALHFHPLIRQDLRMLALRMPQRKSKARQILQAIISNDEHLNSLVHAEEPIFSNIIFVL